MHATLNFFLTFCSTLRCYAEESLLLSEEESMRHRSVNCVMYPEQVYTEREWKKTKFAGKTKTMPEGIADVDMALDKTLVFD